MTAAEKLQTWIDKHPEDYLEKSNKTISIEAGISPSSVQRHLPILIAKRDGILASEVVSKREVAGYKRGSKALTPQQIQTIQQHHDDGLSIIDIQQLTGHDERTIKKYVNLTKTS